MIEFKGSHFERDVILWGVRWYVAYPINYRQLEEMMEERGVEVDHSTLNRWVVNRTYRTVRQAHGRSLPGRIAATPGSSALQQSFLVNHW
jgi:putative transposase